MRIFFFEISRKLASASEPASYTCPVGARKGIRCEIFGCSFHEKISGPKIVLSLILIHENFLFRDPASASEPASYICLEGARKGIRGEIFGRSFHEKIVGPKTVLSLILIHENFLFRDL